MAVAQAEQEDPVSKLAWQVGPGVGLIGDKATINIPEGYGFLNAAETKKFMDMNQNFSNGKEYLLAPPGMSWFAIFSFNPVGYVKDDETVNANEILDAVKQGTETGNEERRKRGWSTMTVKGWRFQPQYDSQAKLLEWALLAKNDRDNTDVVNYNTRLLGRTGVMEVVLVSDPTTLDGAVGDLKKSLGAYSFVAGEKYSEFKAGDHVAEFGLAALVAGGAAAVAAKKGFFAAIGAFLAATWKLIAAAFVGVFYWLRNLFSSKKDQ
ncbi:MAG TPA: DUF2167 domain-containing protein [Gallionellaceae bacterium]|nr:DUF2167 domain-containing protein [Gallionellaceae bacterium]